MKKANLSESRIQFNKLLSRIERLRGDIEHPRLGLNLALRLCKADVSTHLYP